MERRKTIARKITLTTIKCGEMEIIDGQPKANELDDVKVIGSLTMEKAVKIVKEKYGLKANVLHLVEETNTYRLPIETFIEHATIDSEQTEIE